MPEAGRSSVLARSYIGCIIQTGAVINFDLCTIIDHDLCTSGQHSGICSKPIGLIMASLCCRRGVRPG